MSKPTEPPGLRAGQLRSAWPQVKEVVFPRGKLLAASFLLLVVNRTTGLVLPYSSKLLLDRVIARADMHFLGWLVLGVLLATLIQSGTSFWLVHLLSKEGQRVIARLRCKVHAHITRLPVSFFDSNKTGALISRIMSDVEGVRNFVGTGLLEFVGGALTAVIVLAIMFRVDTLMTLAVIALLLVLMLLQNQVLARLRPVFRERGMIAAEVTGRLAESLGGIRVVKGYSAERREQEVFGSGVQRILENSTRTITLNGLLGLSSTLIMGVVGVVIMYIGAHRVAAHTMTPGELFQYILFAGYVSAPVFQISSIGTQINEALAGLDRTREILQENPEDQDAQRVIELQKVAGHVVFEDVCFSYTTANQVLENISFEAKPGTVTALVGSSGSGKSTIIGLVAAFYKPSRGRVLIDGADLNTVWLESYRHMLGIVLQEPFLFDGSIRDNVAFSCPTASEQEIMRACKLAHVSEFAERFKDKYSTIVGERGVKLSGGQRQRISIARAILADPKILILDEATSNLDSQSEAYIREGLRSLMHGRTTLVIAHRLSTVREADQILVVEAGRIVERGTHAHLYALNGRYRELYTTQHDIESNLLPVA
ncbi:MAG TPA: ABC transporter ATP-binding protein [Candidatus Angelobacter sp.]|nr:ABC transporter ATP-binding protein [Candidatus Angelobacter sp.]